MPLPACEFLTLKFIDVFVNIFLAKAYDFRCHRLSRLRDRPSGYAYAIALATGNKMAYRSSPTSRNGGGKGLGRTHQNQQRIAISYVRKDKTPQDTGLRQVEEHLVSDV